jgi:hypothetical protein
MNQVVYISGGMTGIKDHNIPEFNRVAEILKGKGYEVINPAEFGFSDEFTWEDYMKRDIGELVKADIVATLNGWENSRGARLEVFIARELGIEVYSYWQLL